MTRRPVLPIALVGLLLSACERYGRGYYRTGPAWGLHVSIVGTVILIGDFWTCYHVWSGPRGLIAKVLWTLLVVCFPFGGLVLFWLFGDKRLAS